MWWSDATGHVLAFILDGVMFTPFFILACWYEYRWSARRQKQRKNEREWKSAMTEELMGNQPFIMHVTQREDLPVNRVDYQMTCFHRQMMNQSPLSRRMNQPYGL